MYTPPKFKIEDHETIHTFIDENAFGLLLTIDGADIHDTHTPFIRCPHSNRLFGHIARANPQWKNWQPSTTAKVIFTGPHAYISPRYYASEFNVPTWNYTAVSVTGRLSIISDETQVLGFLDGLIARYENTTSPWKLNRDDERYMNLLAGIVVFSISMERIEASFKLNQNKKPEDQRSVIAAIENTGCPFEAAVAQMMRSNLSEEKNQSSV